MTTKALPTVEVQEQSIKQEKIKLATQSILELMELENISLICYVDDKVDVNNLKDEYIGSLNALYAKGDKPKELDFVDWTLPKAKFQVEIGKDWDDFSTALKKINFHKLSIYLEDSNSIPALYLKEILEDKIRLFSPKEWIEDEYNIIKELQEGERILCLFDIEFEGKAQLDDGRNGLDLAKHLLDSELNEHCICGVFSHVFTIDNEDDKRAQISAEKGIPKNKFYTIAKERFAFDPKISAFAEGVKNLTLLPYIEILKENSINSFESSFSASKAKISDISPKTFNQIVQKSSLKEGVWEVNTLFRLFSIISKEENLNHILNAKVKQSYIDSIKKIRSIDDIETGYESAEKNQQLLDLRSSELYLQGKVINKLHFPVSNGDLFEINNKEYILLVQPCNLAVRTNRTNFGKRNFDYKNAILVPLKTKPVGEFRKTVSNEIIEYPNFSNQVKYADFPSFKTASLDLIDLVVFNEDGVAKIDMNESSLANELIHHPWLKRYEYIYKEFKKFEGGLVNLKNLQAKFEINRSADFNSLKAFVFAPECLRDFKINGEDIYNYETRKFEFKIKRVSHYKTPFSDDLLQKFMLYLSRNAFDHDFTT